MSGSDIPPVLGRRERKRQETRNKLIRAALDLFSERGFDAVTVNDIAEHADMDPSTFFRHFGSKEAVIFSEYGDWIGRLADAIRKQPKDVPLLDALHDGIEHLLDELEVDFENERRRAQLIESSPSVRAEGLVVRENLILDVANAVAERLGVDVEKDSRPFLVAATWIFSANWYRSHIMDTGKLPKNSKQALDGIMAHLHGLNHLLSEASH